MSECTKFDVYEQINTNVTVKSVFLPTRLQIGVFLRESGALVTIDRKRSGSLVD